MCSVRLCEPIFDLVNPFGRNATYDEDKQSDSKHEPQENREHDRGLLPRTHFEGEKGVVRVEFLNSFNTSLDFIAVTVFRLGFL